MKNISTGLQLFGAFVWKDSEAQNRPGQLRDYRWRERNKKVWLLEADVVKCGVYEFTGYRCNFSCRNCYT